MNERIKLLKQQAGIDLNPDQEGLDLFAELIVEACGRWFNDRLVVNPDYGIEHRVERNRAVIGLMKEFKEHFG
jgi:hypothetical protein